MYEKLTEQEIEFMEFYHDPVVMLENIMPVNINAPSQWDENTECVTIRPYQFAMLGYDYLYEEDSKKSAKQNMQIRKGAGNVFNISARNIGKTFLGLVGDDLLALLHYNGIESCIGSFDEKHLKEVSEKICNFVEGHKLFKMLNLKGGKKTVGRSPHRVHTRHGHLQIGVNEKVSGKNVGTDFHGKHYQRFSYDEASYMSEEGTEKRIDSGSSLGYVERLFGIPDLRVGSPLGAILSNPKNKPYICRLPQYVRDDWDEAQQQKMADQYGGRSSMSYKLNVGGELIEGAFGKWDMERLKKKCYNALKKIKFFEVDKELFRGLDKLEGLARKEEFDRRISKKIIIDRLPCTQIILSSDIGTSGSPSEVAIFFGDADGNFRYEYQISLFKLIPKEQAQVFKWMYDRLGSCFVSLDCTNMDGATIRQMLVDDHKIPVEHLTEYKMNENIEVGFETDEKTGKVKRSRGGQPIMIVKNTKEWAIKCLEDIFYGGNVEIPHDEKFLREFAGFFERYTGNRPSWGSTTTDHLLDSFLLFALCAWENINKISQNKKTKKRVLGVI